jgi:hypothetical protein
VAYIKRSSSLNPLFMHNSVDIKCKVSLTGKNGSGASETKHWQDMITKPRQTIVQWHRLKPE